MAHDIVIAGGGFAGANAARELEKILPRQSTRLILVNDVNFLLYTPLLPEAAAGTLEPRHVVTPLRDILKRTYLRLGAVTGSRPRPPDGRADRPRRRRRGAPLRPAAARARLGQPLAADPGPRPARDRLQEPRRRDLAPQPPGRDARGRERQRGSPSAGPSCSPTSSSAAATPASRRSPSFRTSPPTRWTTTRAPGCRGCAGSSSRRPTAFCPRSTRSSPTTRSSELRGRGMDIRLGTTLERGRRGPITSALDGRADPDPDRRLDRRRRPAPEPQGAWASTLDERGRVPVDERMAVPGLERRLRRRRLRRGPEPRRRPLPADRPARDPPGARRRPQHGRRLGVGEPTRPSPTGAAAPSSTSAATRPWRAGAMGGKTLSGFPAWWAARTYHVCQIPGLARKLRAVADWTVGLPFARDTAEVGSIGHPAPAPRRGLRERRQPPPDRRRDVQRAAAARRRVRGASGW